MGKGTVVMMQLMAAMQPTEKIVDEAIEALQKYKDGGYQEKDEPAAQVMMCIIKWEQGEKANPFEVMERAIRDENIIHKAVKEMKDDNDNRAKSTIPEDYISDSEVHEAEKEIKVKVYPMGEPGEA